MSSAATRDSQEIVVATSIPPRLKRVDDGRRIDLEYQKLCIRSWLDCGFRILSVNDRSEIADLAPRFPEVTFVPTDRNASALSGRKNPFIVDLLSALIETPASALGIVNSDIVFEPAPSWRRRLPELADNGVVTGQRLDTIALANGMLEKHPWGYDYFFFDKEAALELVNETRPFAMGLPWWDYWLPLTLALRGRKLTALNRPSIMHLYHDTAYDQTVWREFAAMLSAMLIGEAETSTRPVAECVATVLPLCREVAQLSDTAEIEAGSADELVQKLADKCAKSIRRELIELGATDASLPSANARPLDLDPARIFGQLPVRIKAGECAVKARELAQDNLMKEAGEQYRTALRSMPNDCDLLFSYGDLLIRQRDPAQAAALFRKLVQMRPDHCNGINAFGVALDNMGRLDEAISCFERVLELDPECASAYYNLALTLYKTRRHGEAVARLERELASRKDFAVGVETYCKLLQMLRYLSGDAAPRLKQYFSRYGEDALLDEFFGFRAGGQFVDVGAGNGFRFNSTYIFEQRGWSGLCILPTSEAAEKCRKNRPRSQCAAVTLDGTAVELPEDGTPRVDFVSISADYASLEMLSRLAIVTREPRVLLITIADEEVRKAIDDWLAEHRYRHARSLGQSRFYVSNEDDRRALRAITVSALLARPPAPYETPYVYSPALP